MEALLACFQDISGKIGADTSTNPPSTFADHSGRSQQHRKEVAKGTQGNQHIQPLDGIALAKNGGKEQASGNLTCGPEIFEGYYCNAVWSVQIQLKELMGEDVSNPYRQRNRRRSQRYIERQR